MIAHLPALNASLNFASALFLGVGYAFIRQGRVDLHRVCMGIAFTLSVIFLVSYLTYHAHVGNVRFLKQGWIRPVYFSILISHTILAVTIVPLVLRTLYLALNARFADHKAWARWTLPLWFYVSVTGVVIYEMLY